MTAKPPLLSLDSLTRTATTRRSRAYRVEVSCTMPLHPPYCRLCLVEIHRYFVRASTSAKFSVWLRKKDPKGGTFFRTNMLVGSPRLRAVFSMSPTNRPRQQSRIIIVTNTLFKDDEEKCGRWIMVKCLTTYSRGSGHT